MTVVQIPSMECMLDIETLDVGDRSVVLSIAAQGFNDHEGWEPFEPFVRKLDVDFQLQSLCRTVSLGTIGFWLRQDSALAAEQLSEDGRVPVPEALDELRLYLARYQTVWANGPSFDGTNVGSLYDDMGQDKPWRYNALRDVRTMREESGLPRDWQTDKKIPGQLHDPLYDCRWQIELVLAARREIRRGWGR